MLFVAERARVFEPRMDSIYKPRAFIEVFSTTEQGIARSQTLSLVLMLGLDTALKQLGLLDGGSQE